MFVSDITSAKKVMRKGGNLTLTLLCATIVAQNKQSAVADKIPKNVFFFFYFCFVVSFCLFVQKSLPGHEKIVCFGFRSGY